MNEMKVEVKRIVLDGEKYEAKRVQAMKKISKGLSDKKEYISACGIDLNFGMLTMVERAVIYERDIADYQIEVIVAKPRFTDWLFKRERRFKQSISIQEVLENVPESIIKFNVVER